MADNCNKKIHETLYTLLFADFFDTYSQRKTYEVPTRYRADTGKVFFIISILKQSSRCRRRQRVGTSRYCYDLYYVPPAIVFFAVERPWFNLGAYWVVKPLKYVYYDLKGRGPLKNGKNLRECWQIKGPSIGTTQTSPLFSFYTTFKADFMKKSKISQWIVKSKL